MTTVYVARPIDLSTLTEEQAENYLFVVKTLADCGCVLYEPGKAFTVGPDATPHGTLQAINRYALRQADALVAFYPELPGVGVSMELEQARAAGQPILVITDAGKRSWSLAGVNGAEVVQYPDLAVVDRLMDRARLRTLRDGNTHPLRFQLDDGATLPTRGYPGDAGYDLYVQEDTWIPATEFVDIPCGCAVQLPDHLWGMITGRSSTLRKHNLLVATGIIDTGYRGPLFAGVKNLNPDYGFEAKRGMRLAQLIPLVNSAENLTAVEVQTLDPSERGTAGFGSSGE